VVGFTEEISELIWEKIIFKVPTSHDATRMHKQYSDSLDKKRKSEKKVKLPKFQPTGLAKPARSGREIFIKKIVAANKMKDAPEKMNLAQYNSAWNSLPEKEKLHYNKKCADMKTKYKTESDAQLATAVSVGDYPEPKPKRPASPYIIFCTRERPSIKAEISANMPPPNVQGLTPEESKSIMKTHTAEIFAAIQSELSRRWAEIDPEDKEVLQAKYNVANTRSTEELQKWKARNEARIKAKTARGTGTATAADTDDVYVDDE
jgi:hypothetical protein